MRNSSESIDLDNKRLSTVPDYVFDSPNLRELRLANNYLTTVPESIGRLTKLEILILDNNRLESLPNALLNLKNLKRLYLHNNPLLKIPREILGPSRFDVINESTNAVAILDWYFRDPNLIKAEGLEREARALLRGESPNLEEAREKLLEIVMLNPDSGPKLVEEFRFVLRRSLDSESSFPEIGVKETESILAVWRILSEDSYAHSPLFPVRKDLLSALKLVSQKRKDDLELKQEDGRVAGEHDPNEVDSFANFFNKTAVETASEKTSSPSLTAKISATAPQAVGDALEQAVFDLLRSFFPSVETEKLRRQKSGTQFGRDLEFSFTSNSFASSSVVCHVECKNYTRDIRHSDVVEKLSSFEYSGKKIDHWILISPHSSVSNELNELIEHWRVTRRFDFSVQIWSRDNLIEEFFAISPKVHQAVYYDCATISPLSWSDEERVRVISKWKQRLLPYLRLPSAFINYLKNPSSLCFGHENRKEFESVLRNYIPPICRTAESRTLTYSLEKTVQDWLTNSESQCFVLVAEFGEGKSFFSYLFSRILIREYLNNPNRGWIPLRIPLKNYSKAGSARSLLESRLQEFGATISDWRDVAGQGRVLLILDGFDEMSLEMTKLAFTENLENLLECKMEFSECKILITSRPNDLGGKRDKKMFMDWMDRPMIRYIAPPSRSVVEAHLKMFIEAESGTQLLWRLRKMHDPIGLSMKPLFLQMLKDTLDQLPPDIDVISLYECYSRNVLERKVTLLLRGDGLSNTKEELVCNLMHLMEVIAVAITKSSSSFFSLKELDSENFFFAEILWRSSDPDFESLEFAKDHQTLNEDARARVRTRSLLTRVELAQDDDTWTVDFCHRSMREYFAASALARAIVSDKISLLDDFSDAQLNLEILDFCTILLLRNRAQAEAAIVNHFVSLKNRWETGRIGGYLLTILCKLGSLSNLSDLSGFNFDHVNLAGANLSEKDFSGSSLRFGILDNTILDRANFSNCDMTGVRLEETTLALGIATLGDRLFVMYTDYKIRVWTNIFSEKIQSRVVHQVAGSEILAFGALDEHLLWMNSRENIRIFFVDESDSLHECCRFRVRADVFAFFLSLNAVAASAKGRRVAAFRALSGKQNLRVVEGISCDCFTSEASGAILFATANGRLEIFEGSGDMCEILEFPEKECATSLAVCRAGAFDFFVACGFDSGRVIVWSLNQTDWKMASVIFDKIVHFGAVSSVQLSDSLVVSAGADKEVLVSEIAGTERLGDAAKCVRLGLRVSCKDTNVSGIRGEREVRLFHDLIHR